MSVKELSASVPVYEYGHLILFDWNPDCPCPFKVFPRDLFPEIKDSWFNKKLDENNRTKVYSFGALNEQETSIFVKIQKGRNNNLS